MATQSMQANSTGSDSIIAGYFSSGEDAHRAINALLDEGFLASQIGAAFHTSGGGGDIESSPIQTGSMRQELGSTVSGEGVDSDGSAGGAMSDTTAVQPVGLASGSGSPILGAGKPGPISGSELEHTGLPSELESELAHDQPGSAPRQPAASPVINSAPQQHIAKADNSWASKLKHLFQSKEDDTKQAVTSVSDEESQNFGTGEGHLVLPSRPYSATAFETSVSGAGVPAKNSRHLAHRLSTGGAVVTVNDTGRAIEVEKIFEEHNGVVRFSSDLFNDTQALGYEPRVEVFGHLEHRYPVL